MPQSTHDTYWSEARAFLKQYYQQGERILAPNHFSDAVLHTYPYSVRHSQSPNQFDWVVIHKGLLDELGRDFLRESLEQFKPIFANEVFVIVTKRNELNRNQLNSIHFQDLINKVDFPDLYKSTFLSKIYQKTRIFIRKIKNILLFQSSTTILQRLHSLEAEVRQLKDALEIQTRSLDQTHFAAMAFHEFATTCRMGCSAVYLGNNTILCRVLTKYLVYVDSRDLQVVPMLVMRGYWEHRVTLAVIRLIKPGWRCIDVGANHGYYSLLMADLTGHSGSVIAIEPNPDLVRQVHQSLKVNNLVERTIVLGKAVSDQSGEWVKLAISSERSGVSSMFGDMSVADRVIEVETVTIDELAANSPVHFIKVDAEGAEELVWRGMKNTIHQNPDIVILLEFGAVRYPDPQAFLQDMIAEGFILRHIDARDGRSVIEDLTIERCLAEKRDSHWELLLSRSSNFDFLI
jgi:FkbM family methyltransferase